MRAATILTLLMTASASLVHAAEEAPGQKRVAVLQVVPHPTAQNPEMIGFSQLLADAMRQGALEATQGSPYSVMTRDIMQSILDEMPVCDKTDGECSIGFGELLSVDYVLGSELAFLDGSYILKMELYNVRTRALVELDRLTEANRSKLLELAQSRAATLLRKGLKVHRRGTSGFGGDVELRVPQIDTSKNKRPNLAELNAHAESLYGRALKVQADERAPPERKEEVWCALAAITENNRYLETASAACDGWRKYVSDLSNLRSSLPVDYDKIAALVGFDHYSSEDKLVYMDEFLETYSILGDSPLVQKVRDARRLVNDKKPVVLMSRSEMAAEEVRKEQEQRDKERELERQRENERRQALEEEREAAERSERVGRTAGALMVPGFRIFQSLLGVAFQAITPPIILGFWVLFGASIMATASSVFSKTLGSTFGGSSDVLLILAIVLIPATLAGVGIAVFAGGGIALRNLFKPFKGIFDLGAMLLVGTNLAHRPITRALHSGFGNLAFICSLCAPFCVLDYTLGFFQIMMGGGSAPIEESKD